VDKRKVFTSFTCGAVTVTTGSLVIVGHGIKGPVQLTAEAVSHIQNADEVFFLACDPLTEQWIRSNNPNSHDLHTWYDNSRPRIDTYAMMTLDMVEEVKKGKDVVGVFYGHPGVFVNPGHNAVAEARRLGYYAEMLPGVSLCRHLWALYYFFFHFACRSLLTRVSDIRS